MKKFGTFIFSILLFAPAFALADSMIPVGPTPPQLLSRVATLEAQEASLQTGESIACAILFNVQSAKVGQQVVLAWGSVGAVDQTKDPENMRPTNGAVTLLFSNSGSWNYSFTFYDANGKSVACSAKILVTK